MKVSNSNGAVHYRDPGRFGFAGVHARIKYVKQTAEGAANRAIFRDLAAAALGEQHVLERAANTKS